MDNSVNNHGKNQVRSGHEIPDRISSPKIAMAGEIG
jgi:hypothetical protein